jgi:N-acylglucosamine 2-epimerase
MQANFRSLAEMYRDELLENVLPFWLDNSIDQTYGGYYTCLTRDGKVFDTDKFIWLQGRQVWMFSMLYNKVEKRREWLDCAIQGGEFLKKYGHDGNFNWYFSVTREGHPIIEPYSIFAYTFATMAFGQLSLATGNEEYAGIAKKTFEIILSKTENPKGPWNKAHTGTRNLKNFALPMILCNLSLEIEHLIEPSFLQKTIDTCIHEVMDVFYRPELGIILESVTKNTGFRWRSKTFSETLSPMISSYFSRAL